MTDADRLEAGRALVHEGRFEKAVAVMEEMEELEIGALALLGFAYGHIGRTDWAMTYYDLALRFDRETARVRSYMGRTMLAAGDRAGALEQLRLIRADTGPVSLQYVVLRDALMADGSAY